MGYRYDHYIVPANLVIETDKAYRLEIFDEVTGEIIKEDWFPKSKCFMEEDGQRFTIPRWLLETKGIELDMN